MTIVDAKYQTDENPGLIVLARVEQSTIDMVINGNLDNREPGGNVNLQVTALSGTRRTSYGIHMRGVKIRWTGEPPPGYSNRKNLFVPYLRFFQFRQIKVGFPVTYLGTPAIVVSKIGETFGG